tara:strand:- start:155 stop:484 length:330 start_codon:yes stop_codon:yes gene_type:complete
LSYFIPAFIKALPTINWLLGLILGYLTIAFLLRIILTWYPKINISKGFWNFLSWPTEPVLKITRKFVAPIGGVDVTPVIWVGLISLIRELLVGPQGLLSQIVSKSTYFT